MCVSKPQWTPGAPVSAGRSTHWEGCHGNQEALLSPFALCAPDTSQQGALGTVTQQEAGRTTGGRQTHFTPPLRRTSGGEQAELRIGPRRRTGQTRHVTSPCTQGCCPLLFPPPRPTPKHTLPSLCRCHFLPVVPPLPPTSLPPPPPPPIPLVCGGWSPFRLPL